MKNGPPFSLSRRALVLGGGAALVLGGDFARAQGRLLPFLDEQDRAVGRLEGAGLAGRLASDLTQLDQTTLITPSDQVFVRTRFPQGAPPPDPWRVKTPAGEIAAETIAARASDQGLQLLECSGNGPNRHFGLISVARFAGLALSDLIGPLPAGRLVQVTGFDRHQPSDDWSQPGASWIFRPAELAGAFLASALNGRPLAPDQGAPLRLLVPGWYGCCCIKWVTEIAVVPADAPATGQMRDFASRTHQPGVPALARDFLPSLIDPAAMAVRVERLDSGELLVTGLQWGGPTVPLSIQFGQEPAVPVQDQRPGPAAAWSPWRHRWRPTRAGPTEIRLRVADPAVRTRRLDRGYYTRKVLVP